MKRCPALYVAALFASLACGVSAAAAPCSATWAVTGQTANTNCFAIRIWKRWLISWGHGISENVENYGDGDCRAYEPVEKTPESLKCYPTFYEPSVRRWTANGYEYGE